MPGIHFDSSKPGPSTKAVRTNGTFILHLFAQDHRSSVQLTSEEVNSSSTAPTEQSSTEIEENGTSEMQTMAGGMMRVSLH